MIKLDKDIIIPGDEPEEEDEYRELGYNDYYDILYELFSTDDDEELEYFLDCYND